MELIKMVLPIKDIETARKEKAYHWVNHGLVTVIRGHEELFFEFSQEAARDECLALLEKNIEMSDVLEHDYHASENSGAPDQVWFVTKTQAEDISDIQDDLDNAAERSDEDVSGIMFDSNAVSIVSFKPSESLRFTCLTIGSRGDVQPYIALCKVFCQLG
jgi:sterol 3beta-glucosyltransferase